MANGRMDGPDSEQLEALLTTSHGLDHADLEKTLESTTPIDAEEKRHAHHTRRPPWLQPPTIRGTFEVVRRFRQHHNIASLAIAALSGFLLCLCAEAVFRAFWWPAHSSPSTDFAAHGLMKKPDGVKIIGLVFYGRPMFVTVLDCYLQRNLAVNGGWLDQVVFVANTLHEEDLAWLDKLLETTPQYIKVDETGPWSKLWRYADTLDPDTIIVKIDDDIIYMHENAVPSVVTSLITHPEAFAVGGNVVNTPHSHFWQYHTGTLLPYLPEDANLPSNATLTWRASQLPMYHAPKIPPRFDWNANRQPLHNLTRWLPLPHIPTNLMMTPAWNASWPDPHGGATMFKYADEVDSWAMAAQIHYSLLDNLERGRLHLYWALGGAERDNVLWNQQYERYSINFVAVHAGRISEHKFAFNDEIGISMMAPRPHDQVFYVDMRAVVSHFSFSTQHELLKTDLLARYLAYANEMVCAADNQKVPLVSSLVRTGN